MYDWLELLSVQLIGLAFEVHDTALADKKKDSADYSPEIELESEATRVVPPDILDVYHYSFCYIGVLTGTVICL